jgi:hypothetical protein
VFFSFLFPFFFLFLPSCLLPFLILSVFPSAFTLLYPLPLSFTSSLLLVQFPHPPEVPLSDLKCHPQHTVPFCACLLQAPIRSLREVREVYGHGHVTFNSLRQFVLAITDDIEAERLYQSINCSTVDDKHVFRYSVCQICTGVHLLQMSCCCTRPDHELHGVRTVISFRLLFSIQKDVPK